MSQLKGNKITLSENSLSQEQNMFSKETAPKFKILLIDIILILCFSCFMCLYKIEVGSFGNGDQTTHSLVVQEMNRSGDFLHPKYHGRGYYNKPPFKMWLVAIVVKFLGESNFSYRVIDGLTGIGISLMLFVFSYKLFSSRIAAYFSIFALFGSHLFFYGHGIRNAVQDSMMILLMSLGTICGWYLLEAIFSNQDRKEIKKYSILGGVLIGLAALTKNVAGYFAYIIIGIFLLCTGRIKEVLSYYKSILSSISISLLFPLAYLLAQGSEVKNAWYGLMVSEVYKRAVKGYHNIKNTWFYWNVIVEDRLLVPPELLLIALIFASYKIYQTKDRKLMFILTWAFVPVIVQNIMKSKLEWYILPALPGMCLLFAATISSAINQIQEVLSKRSFKQQWKNIKLTMPLCFCLYSAGVLSYNNYHVAKFFLTAFRKNAAERISQEIRDYGYLQNKRPTIALYHLPKLANHELLYFSMDPINLIEVKHIEELKKLVNEKKVDFVFTVKGRYDEIAALSPQAVAALPKRDQRKRRLNIFAFNSEIIPTIFFKKL